MRAREVVLATGAIERPLVFPDNDRPAVMLADAARRYALQYGAKVGERVVVATAHDSAYRAALDLKKAGVQRRADRRSAPRGQRPAAGRRARRGDRGRRRAPKILGVDGRLRVKAVRLDVVRREANRRLRRAPDVGRLDALGASLLAIARQACLRRGAAGFQAGSVGAARALGRRLQRDLRSCRRARRRRRGGARSGERPPASPRRSARAYAVGERCPASATGTVRDRRLAPIAARRRSSISRTTFAPRTSSLAVQEGMRSIEHIKRYTTTGMATDQGKLSNMNALGIAAAALEKPIPEVGLTTFRPPYTPVTFGAFAGPARGDMFDPIRRTPIHEWAAENGAAFEDVGQWKRAWYFPQAREIDARRGRARVPHDARERRPVRRLHARQDRGRRPRRGGVPRAHVRQRLPEARGRALPLRPHAERGRLPHGRRGDRAPWARPLPCDDDDRRRAARARAYGGLSADRVHRSQGLAHFDHRAMGDDRRAGTARAGDDRAPCRGRRSLERRLCRI